MSVLYCPLFGQVPDTEVHHKAWQTPAGRQSRTHRRPGLSRSSADLYRICHLYLYLWNPNFHNPECTRTKMRLVINYWPSNVHKTANPEKYWRNLEGLYNCVVAWSTETRLSVHMSGILFCIFTQTWAKPRAALLKLLWLIRLIIHWRWSS